MSTATSVAEAAEHARRASRGLALATRAQKDRALHAMADALGEAEQRDPRRQRGGRATGPRPVAHPATSSTGSG